MGELERQLAKYASYHRDLRNVITHFIGIPVIVLSVFVLLAKPSFDFIGISLTPALVVFVLSTLYYIKLSVGYGFVMFLAHGVLLYAGLQFGQLPLVEWALWGVGLFFGGWVVQFIGHYFEGRKPAFADDLIGLVIGPLFVVAEAGFMVGLGKGVQKEVERVTGPLVIKKVGAVG